MIKSKNRNNTTKKTTNDKPLEYSLGVDMKSISNSEGIISVYENRSFTPQGDLKGYDVNKILKNKQENIYRIFELMSYYVEADSVLNAVIKKVLTPFSVASGWKLHGASEKVKQKFLDHFEEIGLNDLVRDIFYDLYLYGQCYLYDRDGKWFDIFPAHRIRISSIGVNGQPILEYKIEEFTQTNVGIVRENFIKTLEEKYKGYPKEILEGIKNRQLYVQLNPQNCYTIQDVKSRWEKYAMPVGVAALKAFNKKNLISSFEDAQLNLGMKGFLHVKVGDKDIIKTPDKNAMIDVGQIFKNAINGFPLAVTAFNVSSEFIKVDTKELFTTDKYKNVNNEILSACGIASIVATGDSSSSSFASAQININTTEKRIIQNQRNVAEFIKWIIKKRAIDFRISSTKLPEFIFNSINLANDSTFKDEVLKIYEHGLLSRQTTIENLSFDFNQERERKQNEISGKLDEVFVLPPSFNNQSNTDNKGGRPVDPNADKSKSASGKAPKPSTV